MKFKNCNKGINGGKTTFLFARYAWVFSNIWVFIPVYLRTETLTESYIERKYMGVCSRHRRFPRFFMSSCVDQMGL